MAYPKRFIVDTIRTLAFGAIGAAYAAIGAVLASPCRILSIKNLTDQTILFSVDGTNDHFILPTGGFEIIDISANRTTIENFFLSQGTIFYAQHNGVAPTTGAVYIEIIRS